jgi:hypothetical protein
LYFYLKRDFFSPDVAQPLGVSNTACMHLEVYDDMQSVGEAYGQNYIYQLTTHHGHALGSNRWIIHAITKDNCHRCLCRTKVVMSGLSKVKVSSFAGVNFGGGVSQFEA